MAGARDGFLDTSDDEIFSPTEQKRVFEQEPFDVEVIPTFLEQEVNYFINPINMSPQMALVLTQFLHRAITELGEILIRNDVSYEVIYEGSEQNKLRRTLSFPYDMAWYFDDEFPEEDQFAVISNTIIDEGSFCQVKKVKGILKASPTGTLFYQSHKDVPPDKKLVARFDFHKEGWTVENARNVFELTKSNKQLGLKYPMWTKTLGDSGLGGSVGIMRRLKSHNLTKILAIEGEEPGYLEEFLQTHHCWDLFEIFDLINRDALNFSDLEKLQWSLAIIQAYKQQVLAFDIAHRDIKPENIMMDLSKGPCIAAVTFVDFGDAKKIGDWPEKIVGTRGYIPPEMYELKGSTSSQIDVYALACVLAQWFGDESVYMDSPWLKKDIFWRAQSLRRKFNLAANTPVEIERVLKQMVVRDPDKRPKIEEVEQQYEAVIKYCELDREIDSRLALSR